MRGAFEGLGGRPSSEVEIAPWIRGGSDGPHCVHGPWIGLFLVFSFSLDQKEAVGLRGPDRLTYVLRFKGDLVPWLGCP